MNNQFFYHNFVGYNIHPSRCLVKIITKDNKHFIYFVDINEGTSVTNASEQLATEIVEKMEYDPLNCRFFETYSQYQYDTFDEITYNWKYIPTTSINVMSNDYMTFKAKHPKWCPATKEIKDLFLKNLDENK